MRIREYRDEDWAEWLRMECALFPDVPHDDLISGMREFRARADAAVFMANDASGAAVGFVEVGSRAYAEDCSTSPVGYIEAWYVDPQARRSGIGRALLSAAEDWARGQGYKEMGSDALLDNIQSHEAHRRAGYTETCRLVTFLKPL